MLMCTDIMYSKHNMYADVTDIMYSIDAYIAAYINKQLCDQFVMK